MRLLEANVIAERRALLEEYLLLCAKSRAKESAMDVLLADLKIVGKKLGLHGSRALVQISAERLTGWLDNLFK